MNTIMGLPARAGRGALRALVPTAIVALGLVGGALATSSRAAVAPGNNSLPAISGSPTVGNTLNASNGTWTGSTPLSYQYQWSLCDGTGANCHTIAGATAQTFVVPASEVGSTLRVQVIASNGDGSASASSDATAAVVAASAPSSTALPTISGSSAVGSTLSATQGSWNGSSPLSFAYQWLRCDATGASCQPIGEATGQTYQALNADAGLMLRVQVSASNPAGSASATSGPTADIAGTTSAGCPSGTPGQAVAASAISPPALLQIPSVTNSGIVTAQTQSFAVTVHVSDTCGQPVSGARVYATAVPYGQFAIPAQQTTDATGAVTLILTREAGFPASRNQQLIALFVRATRPGDPLLAGIGTRRLVSVPVNLRG